MNSHPRFRLWLVVLAPQIMKDSDESRKMIIAQRRLIILGTGSFRPYQD
ncbi:unnamed protein product [Acidithrix sp. C25]|nr:unnamed protein product [Acidithrix sp. C25]